MIYRGLGFLAFFEFGLSPTLPFSRQQVVSLSLSSCVSPFELIDGRGEGLGAEPNHMTGSWSSTNHSILSAVVCT
jgi:hypothetical protein